MKICSKADCDLAGLSQPLENFQIDRSKKDGLRPSCKACAKKAKRSHYERNREQVLASTRAYVLANRERVAAYQKKYHRERYLADPEAIAARNKKWRDANPDKVRMIDHNRRGRLLNAGNMPSAAWKALLKIFGAKCMFPGCEATETLELDHIIPLSKGGPNTFANAQILCLYHNRRKANVEHTDYRPNILTEKARALIAEHRK